MKHYHNLIGALVYTIILLIAMYFMYTAFRDESWIFAIGGFVVTALAATRMYSLIVAERRLRANTVTSPVAGTLLASSSIPYIVLGMLVAYFFNADRFDLFGFWGPGTSELFRNLAILFSVASAAMLLLSLYRIYKVDKARAVAYAFIGDLLVLIGYFSVSLL